MAFEIPIRHGAEQQRDLDWQADLPGGDSEADTKSRQRHLLVSAAPLVMPRAAGIATEGRWTPPSSPAPASACRRRKL